MLSRQVEILSFYFLHLTHRASRTECLQGWRLWGYSHVRRLVKVVCRVEFSGIALEHPHFMVVSS